MTGRPAGDITALQPGSPAAFWILLARATVAAALGLALFIQPDKTRPMLVNFIGVFWLVAGLMSLRWGSRGERARRGSIFAGIVGIVAGVVVLARFLLRDVLGESVVVASLGAIAMLIGLLHVFEGIRISPGQRRRSWASTVLGGFEILLGIIVLVWREDFGAAFYIGAAMWAFLGAFVLLREALRQRAGWTAGASRHAVSHSPANHMATLSVLKFSTPEGADRMEHILLDLQKRQLIQVDDAVVVSWPPGRQQPKTKQLHSLAGQAALAGAFWGMLFGLVFFVPFFGLAVGAAMGALSAHFADYGIDDNFVRQTREKITPGTSALFLLSRDAVPEQLLAALEGEKFEIISTSLPQDRAGRLREAFGSG